MAGVANHRQKSQLLANPLHDLDDHEEANRRGDQSANGVERGGSRGDNRGRIGRRVSGHGGGNERQQSQREEVTFHFVHFRLHQQRNCHRMRRSKQETLKLRNAAGYTVINYTMNELQPAYDLIKWMLLASVLWGMLCSALAVYFLFRLVELTSTLLNQRSQEMNRREDEREKFQQQLAVQLASLKAESRYKPDTQAR